MNIVGLDLSLTSTGLASCEGQRRLTSRLQGLGRIAYLTGEILAECALAPIVAIEGYSFGSHSSHAHELGELGGVMRYRLWLAKIPYVDIPPASLKKYATGKGRARKEDMLAAAIRRLDYAGSSFDEADALWLRTMALDHYAGVVAVPDSHRVALAKIDWPVIPSEIEEAR